MKQSKIMTGITALVVSAGMAVAYPINLNIGSDFGLYTDSEGGTFLPAGSYYQIWWSPDANYSSTQLVPGTLLESTADVGTGGNQNGDYVIWSGYTPDDGGFLGSGYDNTGNLTDAMVGGSTISDGHVYGYLYADSDPSFGDQFIMTQIYGPSTTGLWGNPTAAQPPPPDLIDFTPEAGAVMGDSMNFVVPEPGTMALFGLGMLTIAARRRRRA